MANRFEYNFTRESEFEQLRERNNELDEENNLLKKSLEQLIKVNTELTESIQDFNNQNSYHQNNEQLEQRFEMILNENQKLRNQIEDLEKNHESSANFNDNDQQTESLVQVLEQLIESFKNIEAKYESQILDLKKVMEMNKSSYEMALEKVQQELSNKFGTVEALSIQLKRKDEMLANIDNKYRSLEQMSGRQPLPKSTPAIPSGDPNYQAKLEAVNKQLQGKSNTIRVYERLINDLKGKIMEKY